MIDRKLYLRGDIGEAYAYVRVRDGAKTDEDTVDIGVGPDAVDHVAVLNLTEFNDFVVMLNEAAKYFGYELVMSPISLRKKADKKLPPSLSDMDDLR